MIRAADIDDVLALNAACVPEVGAVDRIALTAIVNEASLATLLRDAEGALAFVIALSPTADYGSLNFAWFRDHYARFLYVDRIAVAARARGRGLGKRLYQEVFAAARAQGDPIVTCEVNLLPPNPDSLAFHARLGFRRVGELQHVPGEKEVAMLIADA